MRGIHTEDLVAGGLEVCTGSVWRAVCDDGWDGREARVFCRQLGFPEGEHILILSTHNTIVCVYNRIPSNSLHKFVLWSE